MGEKKHIGDIAIFGGTPAFEKNLHVGCPNIPARESLIRRINDCLDRRWLTNKGRYVVELERRIADYLGVKHCIAICNGTIALEITVKALELKGEVIIPSFTFISTAHALQWLGIRPVFCDIDRYSHNIDPSEAEKLITDKTTAIIGVHLWGRPCNVEALSYLAHKNHLKLLFDAAHAFGVSYNGYMVGSFGNGEVFSFHATKFINTFEGGAVTTNDDTLNDKIRLMKNFGFKGYDNVISLGMNGKMSEISAAMGLSMMEILDELIEGNYRHYQTYCKELDGINGLKLLSYDEKEKCNYQYIVVEIDEQVTSISRDQIVDVLHAEHVIARRYFFPGCHRMIPYSADPFFQRSLPYTEEVAKKVLCLPTGGAVQQQEIKKICRLLRFIIQHGQKINAKLNQLQKKATLV